MEGKIYKPPSLLTCFKCSFVCNNFHLILLYPKFTILTNYVIFKENLFRKWFKFNHFFFIKILLEEKINFFEYRKFAGVKIYKSPSLLGSYQ